MKHLFTFFFLFLFVFAHAQSVVYVTESGSGNGSGDSWSNALPGTKLQSRIGLAPNKTQFWLAKGIYKPTTTTDRTASFSIASGISIYGGFAGNETSPSQRLKGANETTLSGDIGLQDYNQDNSQRIMVINNVADSVHIDGLIIRDGFQNGSEGLSGSCAIHIQSIGSKVNVKITNSSFVHNYVTSSLSAGGAIGVFPFGNGQCNTYLSNCIFKDNLCREGGAVALNPDGGLTTNTLMEDCYFEANRATVGAGAVSQYGLSSKLVMKRCTYTNNSAPTGGAVVLIGSSCLVEDCRFVANSANREGGALEASASQPTFSNCLFVNNSAVDGGAVYSTSRLAYTKLQFTNCTFIKNSASRGGGVFYGTGSERGALTNPNEIYLSNCLVWQNTAPNQVVFKSDVYIDANTSKLEASYSDIQGGYEGIGNINQDPLFVDADRGDYHLKPGSPAINAGDPTSTETTTSDKDLDGNPRILQNRIDMGVYEHPPVGFAITSVGGVSCQLVNADRGEYNVQFAPQYTGQNSNPISFSVVNELSATNRPAPYTLRLYRDNPTITLVANQAGNPEARFRYDWLSSCQSGTSPNQAPTTTGVANQTILQGQPYQLQLSSYFTDPDGQALTYSALNLPQGLALNGSVITGTPLQAGVSMVSITAFDPAGLSVKASFALTIKQTSTTPTSFTITGVSTIKCEALTPNKRLLTFTPQYAGVSGEPISFSVVNEKLPTSNPGPYDLVLYTDNPTIRLSARQGTSAASYTYNWLSACGNPARIGSQESGKGLSVKVLGNPVMGQAVEIEISGASGETIQVQITDQQGKHLYEHSIAEVNVVERVSLPLGAAHGILLLDVSTATQHQQIKLLRP